MFRISDAFFKKVEDKTNVDKSTIMSLADKLQKGDMKDEKVLREVVREISNMTGKDVSKDKEDKIIKTIIEDKVPQDLDNMMWIVYYNILFLWNKLLFIGKIILDVGD